MYTSLCRNFITFTGLVEQKSVNLGLVSLIKPRRWMQHIVLLEFGMMLDEAAVLRARRDNQVAKFMRDYGLDYIAREQIQDLVDQYYIFVEEYVTEFDCRLAAPAVEPSYREMFGLDAVESADTLDNLPQVVFLPAPGTPLFNFPAQANVVLEPRRDRLVACGFLEEEIEELLIRPCAG